MKRSLEKEKKEGRDDQRNNAGAITYRVEGLYWWKFYLILIVTALAG